MSSQLPRARFDEDGGVEVSFPFSAAVVAMLKSEIPPSYRRWNVEGKTWRINALYAQDAIDILQECFGDVEIIDDRRKIDLDNPYAALHLLPSAPIELAETAWRCLAKLGHPDLKSAAEKAAATKHMQQINAAIEAIRKEAANA